jgi:hypothetical protein
MFIKFLWLWRYISPSCQKHTFTDIENTQTNIYKHKYCMQLNILTLYYTCHVCYFSYLRNFGKMCLEIISELSLLPLRKWSVNGYVFKYTNTCIAKCRTNSHWARVGGYSTFTLCVIHKEGLYPSSGDINRLMMIMMMMMKCRTPELYRSR